MNGPKIAIKIKNKIIQPPILTLELRIIRLNPERVLGKFDSEDDFVLIFFIDFLIQFYVFTFFIYKLSADRAKRKKYQSKLRLK